MPAAASSARTGCSTRIPGRVRWVSAYAIAPQSSGTVPWNLRCREVTGRHFHKDTSDHTVVCTFICQERPTEIKMARILQAVVELKNAQAFGCLTAIRGSTSRANDHAVAHLRAKWIHRTWNVANRSSCWWVRATTMWQSRMWKIWNLKCELKWYKSVVIVELQHQQTYGNTTAYTRKARMGQWPRRFTIKLQ